MRTFGISRRAALGDLTAACTGMLLPALRAQEPEVVRVGDAEIAVVFGSASFDLSRNELLAWVTGSAAAVATYYGRFPVQRASLYLNARPGHTGIRGGRTWGDRGAHTRILVGENATLDDLKRDWVLTHEFVHYAFPDVPDQNHWIEEGVATYVEPIARVTAGTFDAGTAWFEMMRDMPQGEPRPGDEGLDNTHTWGRTYWGGALFCLIADVEIHWRTNNRYGLQDALRGIVRVGGNMEHDWPLARALKAGDDAIGVPVLIELYNRMKGTPVTPDLDRMWYELGVRPSGDSVTFDQGAPQASIVRSIMARRSSPGEPCGSLQSIRRR